MDADAHIFRAASSFGTQKGALDAASPARRPCRAGERKKKKLPPPGIEPGSIAWEAISLPLAQEGACMGIESEPLREFLQVPPALVSIDES